MGCDRTIRLSVNQVCGLSAVVIAAALGAGPALSDSGWQFTEASQDTGALYNHQVEQFTLDVRDHFIGGLAAADIDGNGWVDLYVPQGNVETGLLLKNQGNGQFVDVSAEWDLEVSSAFHPTQYASGAAFADLTGNGYPDLVLGGLRGFGLRVYLNDGESFVEATQSWGLDLELQDQFSVSFADVNGSGRLDLAIAHWRDGPGLGGYLWINEGDHLVDVSESWGLKEAFAQVDYTFTPNFADLNGNGWPDLMMAADFETSEYFHNLDGQGYERVTDEVISDENGMGAALGDFSNNGHLDWFVTSIYHEERDHPIGDSGNRLYINDGSGFFSDGTEAANVRDGAWGWGSCAADFNNNGHLDIFMVNGWSFFNAMHGPTPSRMYVNQGDGTFVEQAVELGIDDTEEGRGIVCFDFDRDGDIDIFVVNSLSAGRVYRNNAATLGNHWLGIKLRGHSPNTAAVGARVKVTSGDLVQYREMAIPNHYLSTSPPELHFGLGDHEVVDQVEVQWPGGFTSRHYQVAVDQWLEFDEPGDLVFIDRFDQGEPELFATGKENLH